VRVPVTKPGQFRRIERLERTVIVRESLRDFQTGRRAGADDFPASSQAQLSAVLGHPHEHTAQAMQVRSMTCWPSYAVSIGGFTWRGD